MLKEVPIEDDPPNEEREHDGEGLPKGPLPMTFTDICGDANESGHSRQSPWMLRHYESFSDS